MKWATYTLQQLTRTQNTIGQWIEAYTDVCSVDLVISNNLYTNVTNDIIYRLYAPTAITKYKEFAKDGVYRVKTDTSTYDVKSVNNTGRYTQLILAEVAL